MTNYNEKLDEIVRNAYRGEVSWIHDQLDGTSVLEEALVRNDKDMINTKQAITSYINKAIADVLDRLEPLTHKGRGTIAWEMDSMLEAIQAERQKLTSKE